MNSPKTLTRLVPCAALIMLVGVAAGAFGSHALKSRVAPNMLAVWQTAVQYQLVHGLGMLLIAMLGAWCGVRLFRVAAFTMLAGVLCFSGSLYALVLLDVRWLGAITPAGGVLFMIAWGMVAAGALRMRHTGKTQEGGQ